jgi:hypothetical protein
MREDGQTEVAKLIGAFLQVLVTKALKKVYNPKVKKATPNTNRC